MLENINPADIIFLDIETVPLFPSFGDLDPAMQRLWEKKSANFRKDDQEASDVYQRAGIYSEFGKIICISVGMVKDKNPYGFRLKSFYSEDEKTLLTEFSAMISKFSKNREALLCAHNGKEFDYPYIARRMIINGIKIPVILDTDIGGDIDDTWALAMMLKSPELDVKLVVTDTGNTTYRAKIAAKMLEIAGRTDVPVGVGLHLDDNFRHNSPYTDSCTSL